VNGYGEVFWSFFAPSTASTMPKNGAFIHLSDCP
jgi:hypothetical protein